MCVVALSKPHLFPSPKISSAFHKSSLNSSSSPGSAPSPSRLHVSPPPPSPPSTPLQPPLPPPLVLRVPCQLNPVPTDTVLKRKRPARISVPIAAIGFEEPPADERVEVIEEEGDGYSVYCKRGRRRGAMEDRFSATVDINGDSRQAFFGVFDGHGGAKVAEFAAKRIGKNVMDQVARRGEGEMEEAIKDGYRTTDRQISEHGVSGGACCVAALIRNGNLAVSNVGDCRAVMSRGGSAEVLTSDHRPSREDERNRIEASGGYVNCCRGVWRIQGSLAVSRALGDHYVKQWVISEPDITITKIDHNCDFLILASDGLWDKVTNQEAVDTVQALCGGPEKPQLISACRKLVDLAASRGSVDDTSVMVVKLACFV